MPQNSYKPYKSIETLPMYNYYKTLDTGDLRYLLKGIDIDELPDYKGDLNELWEEINYQVSDVNFESNPNSKNIFDKRRRLTELELEYFMIKTILLGLRAGKDEELLKELAQLGYKIDPNKDYVKEWDRVNKKSENKKVRIDITKSELSALVPKGGKKNNIESVVDDVERFRNDKQIDMHKTSTKKWFVMLNKVIMESSKQASKNK